MRITKGNKKATIKFNREFDEYIVRFYLNDKHLKDADYFTDSREDAIGTANFELNRPWGPSYSSDMPRQHV